MISYLLPTGSFTSDLQAEVKAKQLKVTGRHIWTGNQVSLCLCHQLIATSLQPNTL